MSSDAAVDNPISRGKEPHHAGDCHWWAYRICDCGYLMRANSHDYGEPSLQVLEDFAEHSHNCQTARTKTLVALECEIQQMKEVLAWASENVWSARRWQEDGKFTVWFYTTCASGPTLYEALLSAYRQSRGDLEKAKADRVILVNPSP